MSTKRVSNSRRRSGRTVKETKKETKKSTQMGAWSQMGAGESWPARALRQGLKVHHIAGIALGGGKTDKTCLAMVEYYPEQKKIFLSRLFERIRTENEISADLQLHRLLAQVPGKLDLVAFDVPLSFPKCTECQLACPGFEECSEVEIQWMWKQQRKLNEGKKPKKIFTPYTQRPVELYLAGELEEVFHLPHALGSNVAPLTARARFVARRLQTPTIEVFPKLSVWRIGKALQVARSHLLFHKHSTGGDESRRIFLSRLVERGLAFLYEQDVRAMVENNQAFEAFIGALTAVMNFAGQCEPRPKDFPAGEAWIAIPSTSLKW